MNSVFLQSKPTRNLRKHRCYSVFRNFRPPSGSNQARPGSWPVYARHVVACRPFTPPTLAAPSGRTKAGRRRNCTRVVKNFTNFSCEGPAQLLKTNRACSKAVNF